MKRAKVDWLIWRVAAARAISDTYTDIETKWSVTDLLNAHAVLDAQAEIMNLAIEKVTAPIK